VIDQKTGRTIGVVGEYKASVQKAFKLPAHTAGFELDTRALLDLYDPIGSYQPLSRYPGTERDVCFQVNASVTYADVEDATKSALIETGLITEVKPLDLYQPESGDTKNITVRISLVSYDKTLTGEEVTQVMSTVIDKVTEVTGGKVI